MEHLTNFSTELCAIPNALKQWLCSLSTKGVCSHCEIANMILKI